METKEKIQQETQNLSINEKIDYINNLKLFLHELSPMKEQPVDCVLWVKQENVSANDYNPNSVAPPEMQLLEHSIREDGYTQPIVTWQNDEFFEVVDGFHRNRIGKEVEDIKEKTNGYLPVTVVNTNRTDRSDRIATTIRHNRARGKHQIGAMSEIVIELKKRNWSSERIGKELGMDEDEVLRLCQISGLQDVFSDEDFSKSWEVEIFKDDDLKLLSEDDIRDDIEQNEKRILHTWEEWECYPAGFYEDHPPVGLTHEQCELKYKEFLSNIPEFEEALQGVIDHWKNSCEHYLSNENMNRIAWLGQASLCYKYKIPSRYRGGFNLLNEEQQLTANQTALKYLNQWLRKYERKELTLDEAQSKTEANLY